LRQQRTCQARSLPSRRSQDLQAPIKFGIRAGHGSYAVRQVMDAGGPSEFRAPARCSNREIRAGTDELHHASGQRTRLHRTVLPTVHANVSVLPFLEDHHWEGGMEELPLLREACRSSWRTRSSSAALDSRNCSTRAISSSRQLLQPGHSARSSHLAANSSHPTRRRSKYLPECLRSTVRDHHSV
jgi:hypothetical protein